MVCVCGSIEYVHQKKNMSISRWKPFDVFKVASIPKHLPVNHTYPCFPAGSSGQSQDKKGKRETDRQLKANPVKPSTPEDRMTIRYQGLICSLQLPHSSAIKSKHTGDWFHYYIQLIHFDQQNSDRWCVSTQVIDFALTIGVNDMLPCIDSTLSGWCKMSFLSEYSQT